MPASSASHNFQFVSCTVAPANPVETKSRLLLLNQKAENLDAEDHVANRKAINRFIQLKSHQQRRDAALLRLKSRPWAFSGGQKPPAARKEVATEVLIQTEEEEDAVEEFYRIACDFLPQSPASPASFLDTVDLDPFASGPLKMSRKMCFFYHYCYTTVMPLLYPLKRISSTAMQQFSDAALPSPSALMSAMAFGAFHQMAMIMSSNSVNSTQLARQSATEGSRFRLAAIRMINKALENPSEATQTSTLWAVGNLMAIADMTGTAAESRTHMMGLQNLLSLRMSYEGVPSFIVRLLFMHMWNTMTRLGQRPQLAPPPLSKNGLSSEARRLMTTGIPQSLQLIFTGLESPEVASFLDPHVLKVIPALRDDAQFSVYFYEHQAHLVVEEFEYIKDNLYKSRYRLMRHLFDDEPNLYFEKAIAAALLCFIIASEEFQSGRTPFFWTLMPRIESYLTQLDFEAYGGRAREALLWVLCVGAMHSDGRPERSWFLKQIYAQAPRIGITTLADLRSVLSNYGYYDRIYWDGLCKAWNEIESETDGRDSWGSDADGHGTDNKITNNNERDKFVF